MKLEVLPQDLSVCKVERFMPELSAGELLFTGATDEELSVVCETRVAPDDAVERVDGWRAFRVAGVLDFSLTGILARLTAVLADAGVGIFAVSTYNTDYVLVKARDLDRALCALAEAGYEIVRSEGRGSGR